MFDTYLAFVAERHRIWELRQAGAEFSSSDPVLRSHKFTNVFRVLDFGSQFVLRELLLRDESGFTTLGDQLLRVFLYRYTNRPEPWEWFFSEHGRYPTTLDLQAGELLESWRRYDEQGGKFFGNAYTMFSGVENPGVRRFEWAIGLCDNLPRDGEFYETTSTERRVDILCELPRVGYFMAQQVVTDFGWIDPASSENDWVAPGPGSLRGVAALGATPADFADTVALCQDALVSLHPQVSLELPDGGRWYPTLMDVQNTLCEFSKYVRRLEKPVKQTPYKPAHPGRQPKPVLPAHWKGQPA